MPEPPVNYDNDMMVAAMRVAVRAMGAPSAPKLVTRLAARGIVRDKSRVSSWISKEGPHPQIPAWLLFTFADMADRSVDELVAEARGVPLPPDRLLKLEEDVADLRARLEQLEEATRRAERVDSRMKRLDTGLTSAPGPPQAGPESSEVVK